MWIICNFIKRTIPGRRTVENCRMEIIFTSTCIADTINVPKTLNIQKKVTIFPWKNVREMEFPAGIARWVTIAIWASWCQISLLIWEKNHFYFCLFKFISTIAYYFYQHYSVNIDMLYVVLFTSAKINFVCKLLLFVTTLYFHINDEIYLIQL